MIGSHDTFTYLKSSWIYNNCKKYWKCQKKSIEEQYEFGIRMFDVRVFWDKKWRLCHGKANLKGISWNTLTDIAEYMAKTCPEAIYRLWLEKGDDKEFKKQVEDLKNNLPDNSLLWRVGIKSTKEWKNGIYNRNDVLYKLGYEFALHNTWEYPCYELHGNIQDLDDVFSVDLRKEAKKINANLKFFDDKNKLKAMLESKDKLYLIDYCTNEY